MFREFMEYLSKVVLEPKDHQTTNRSLDNQTRHQTRREITNL